MSQLSFAADDAAEVFGGAVGAIARELEQMPEFLGDPTQRRDRMVAFAQAEAYAKGRSPRGNGAKAGLACIKQHDRLLRWKADLLAAGPKFLADRMAASDSLQRCKEAHEKAGIARADAVGKHQQAERRAKTLEAKLQQAHAQSAQRLREAEQALQGAVAADDESVTDRAAASLTKARKELDAATAALAQGADAEVLAALRTRMTAAKADSEKAGEVFERAQQAYNEAQAQLVQIDIDWSLAGALDKLVVAWHSIGRVGRPASALSPELMVHGVDEGRVPLIGSGLEGLLSILYAPNYAALEVNLSQLSDGNEPRPGDQNAYYYDDKLDTTSVRREAPSRFDSPGPSVKYADPDMNPQRGIGRTNG